MWKQQQQQVDNRQCRNCRKCADARQKDRLPEPGLHQPAAAGLLHRPEDRAIEAGADPVILGAILKKIGIPHSTDILTDFNSVVQGRLDGRWDISAFNFYITPPRCQQVAFTNPLVQYKEGAAVRAGNPLKIHSYADIAALPNVKVGIVAGAAELGYAQSAGIKNPQLFPDTPTVWQALKTGRIDVYLDATHALLGAQKAYGSTGIELATPFTGPVVDGKVQVSYSGWALRYSDVALLAAINQTQAQMIESGEIQQLDKPYGILEQGLPPGNITAKTLCPAAPLAQFV